MTFGDEIRRLRKAQGWTLQNLSERVGVGASYLSQVERGAMPSTQQVKKLAEALGEVDVRSLLGLWLDDKKEQALSRVQRLFERALKGSE